MFPSRSVLIVAGTVSIVLFAMVALGGVRHQPSVDQLREDMLADVRHCTGDFSDVPNVATWQVQRNTPAARRLARCLSKVAQDGRYTRLGVVDPVAQVERDRAEGFRAYRCMTDAGYRLRTQVPLSGERGYPLQLAAGNFRIADAGGLTRFYEQAATCAKVDVAAYRAPDGSFSARSADGVERCVRHRHSGSDEHFHGCFWESLDG